MAILRTLPVRRITVEKGEQGDFFALGLQLSCHCVSKEATQRPAEQAVRSNWLNLSNNSQIFRGHMLEIVGQHLSLSEVARLQSVDRMARWDMTDEPGIGPAQSCGGVDAE